MEVKNKEMARVAVIILNWNGEKLLREFLPSVVKYTDPGLGRIVMWRSLPDGWNLWSLSWTKIRGLQQCNLKFWLIRTGIISSMRGLAEGLSIPWVSHFAGDGFWT